MDSIRNKNRRRRRSKSKIKIKPPNSYVVIFHDDDYTPINFVSDVLVKNFDKSVDVAESLTLKIHIDGSAIVGSYDFQLAEHKASITLDEAGRNNYPLKITLRET